MKPTSASLPPAISPADQSPRRQRLCFAWLLPLLLLSAAWPVMGQWSQVADTGPAARYYTAMAEAPGLGQTILFGGFTGAAQGDTWNWNGSTWQPLAPLAPTPSPRYTHGMAWLPRPGGGQLVLFGGINATGGTLGDTWVWEGAGWRQITGPMPPTRFVVSMASEPTRGRAVMFGGFTGSTVRGDTWTFNGTAWTQHTVTGPSARGGHAMAYDARRDRVVLFGGQTAPNVLSRETWEWVDNAWALVTTNGPAARRDFAMAYRNGRVVLYGGAAGNDVLGDTWELEGAEWVQTAAGCPQPPRFAHAMTTETAGRTVALFGGGFEDLLGDTWRYSGGIIAVPPSDLTVVAGQPATFMVQVGGGGEVSYQWERACGGAGFTAIGGATNSTYTLSAAALGDACLYRCVVSMGACATPSAAARLSVLPADSGPVITRQPSSLTVTPGQPASFTVTAAGAAPLSYQWYQNGQALAGFTIQALDLGPAWPDDAGNYRVVVSNPSGSVTSAPATLSLNVVAPSNQWNVWVDTAASLALVESEVGARGGQVRETSLYFLRVSFSSTEAVFQQIAGLPGVLRAEPQYLPGLFNYNSRTAINTSKVQAAPYGSGVPGLTGLGVVAGVWDGGTAGLTHPDWFPRLTVMENCAPNFGNDTHAAHVIGTMAGDGTIWFNSLAGMAPAATIKDWSFNFCPGFSAPSPFTEMLNARNIGASAWPAPAIDYSQNSWGYVPLNCALYGSYIGDCGDADKLVRQEYLPIFFAAGNSQNGLTTSMAPCGSPYGTVLPPGTAKNVITVGAIDMLDAITVFSSCGPTRDGRLKPDVMALGLGVYSTTDPGWQGVGYFVLSGTSMATPAVSGTAALLIEQFRNLTLPDPSPALLKAIFCNTATDLGNAGPDFQYGYGKVNAEKAVETIVNGDFVDVMANSSGTPGGITQGGVWARSITVPQGCALKVTLAWSDKEYLGTNPHGATLINDLDLHLIDPSSGLHLPLTLNPGTPAALAVPALNRRDNVEQVVVSSAQGGAWSIVVTGFNVPVGPQEFAVTWCIVCPPPCQPQPIQGLWNTGYDTNGNVLPSGAIDPHYALISSPAGFTDARHNYFGSPWLPDGPNSWWLQPGPPAFAPNGTYIYEVTFDLGNCDPNTASITGRWAADDWADLRINNVPVPGVSAAYGFGAWAPLSINSGFVPGVNTIQFVVRNLGGGPTGLRVELSGTVCCNPCVTPPPGMVAWWPLDDLTGSPIETELVATMNGNVVPGPLGSPGAPSAVPGKVAGAMYVMTPAGYAQVPPQPALELSPANFSIDAWIRPVQCGPNHISPIVDKLVVGSGTLGYSLYLEGSQLKLTLGHPAFGGQVFTAPQPITPNTWHFIAVSVDYPNSIVEFYVDGVSAAGLGPVPTPTGPTPNTPLWIGGSRVINAAVPYCEIAIDELEFFNRALSTNDLAPIFRADTAGKCKPQPCQGGFQCAPDKTEKCEAQWTFNPPVSTIPGCALQPVSVSTVTNMLNPCRVQYVRTWTFVDCCGTTSTCAQTVTVVDLSPPVVVCPTNKTVECGSQWFFDPPTALDDCCGTNVTITVLSTFTNVVGPCETVIRRLWEISDCCTNVTTCSQSISVVDTTPPVITCATNKTVECGSQWSFDPPHVWDTCCGNNVTLSVLNTVTNGNGPCSLSITRTWQATDCCTNTAVCSQTVTVMDTIPPVFRTICVTNVTTVGDSTDNFAGPEPAFPSPGLVARLTGAGLPLKGFDDCAINRGVAHTFLLQPNCVVTAARMTMRLKACGSQCDNDSIGLSFTDAAGTLLPGSWGRYLGDGNPSAGLLPGNWCTNTAGVTLTFDLSALPLAGGGTMDLLPDLNLNGFVDFTMQDDSAVDFLSLEIVTCCCAPDKTVACGSQWTFDPPMAVDACCGTNVTVSPISTVTNLLAPCTLLITRTWEARDCCGNKAICSQTVTVIDNTPPIINCAGLQALPITVTNACDGVIPDFCLPQYYSDLCCGIANCVQTPPAGTLVGAGTHAVTLTVTDLAGNVATCTLTFTVNPPSQSGVWNTGGVGPLAANFTVISAPAPIITPTPAVLTTTPGAWLPNNAQSRWVSYTGNSGSAPPGVYVYRLTFLVPCTNGASITGRFLSDDTARMYLNGSPTAAFSASFSTWTPVNLTGPFVPGLNTLDVYVTNAIIWTGIRTELTNNFNCCCPNAVVLVCSSNKVVQCGTQWSFDPPMLGNTNCGSWTTPPPVILSTVTNVTGNCSQTITRTWQATDCCGNTGTCSQTVTVVDTTPPVMVCASNRVVECGTPWSFSPPTVFDACCGTQVTVGVVSTVTNGLCPQYITRTWRATDCCGNWATCSQTIVVVDTTPPVITWCPPSFSVPAGQPWSFNTPQATDTCCGPTIVTLATTTNVSNCLITYTRYWRARDCCGNYSTICSQSITTSTGSVPPNDQCVAAIPLTLNAAYLCGNNICATPTPAAILSQVPCGLSANSPDVWYTVTPACSGLLTVDTCQPCPGRPVFDTVLSAYTGNCGGPLVQVPAVWPQSSCNDDACGLQSRITFPVVAGQTYRIRVAGFNNAVGWFAIRATMTTTPPPNDLCANAIPVTVGNPAACGTTLCGATPTPAGMLIPTPCGASAASPDVWYRFTPTCSGPVTINTCGTCPPFGTFDTVVSVYTGNCPGPLTQVPGGCNDDAGPNGPCPWTLQSYVTFNATAGATYYIRVAGFAAQTGDFRLNINQTVTPPANDLCANATPIGAGTYAWNNCGAITDGPPGTCTPQRDVWFRYFAPCSGAVQLTTCGSPIDTVLAVYSGTCNTPVLLGCNDNATSGPCNGSPQSFVTFNAVAGQSYLIRVGGAGAATGAGVLNVTGPVPPANTCGSGTSVSCRLYRIIGNGNGSPWAWSLSSPCCANLQNLNVPGVVGSPSVLAQQFANSINAICPGTASTFTIFGQAYLQICLRCGPNAPVNLAVGPAGTPPQNLCLVTGTWLPTSGPCSFNPEIVEEPLSGQDANGNGVDDYLDFLSGTSTDRNGNGIPDEAEDCFAPELLAKPGSVLAEPGVDAVLTVEVAGTAPFRYQWFRDGTPVLPAPHITGVNSNVLTFAPVLREDLGHYSVVVSNECGGVSSAAVEIAAPAASQPVIYDAAYENGWFRFYVDTKLGFEYVIEYRDELTEGAWRELTIVPGTGAPQLIYDESPAPRHRFYRVLQRIFGTP